MTLPPDKRAGALGKETAMRELEGRQAKECELLVIKHDEEWMDLRRRHAEEREQFERNGR